MSEDLDFVVKMDNSSDGALQAEVPNDPGLVFFIFLFN